MEQEQQTIWKLYLIIGLLTLNVISCNKDRHLESLKEISYVYKNESGLDLIMEVYDDDGLIENYNINFGSSIDINPTSNISYVFFWFSNHNNYPRRGNFVKVIFNDGNCIEYYRENQDDIFKVNTYDNYSNELLKQNSYTLFYTFTQERYGSSEICN